VDYEKGRDVAHEYDEAHRHEALAASTISLFELAFGVVWDGHDDLETLRESLRWVDFLPFSAEDAIEAATVQRELQSDGRRIPIGDVLVAGVARNRGATLVGSDDHFDRINRLEVETHRESE